MHHYGARLRSKRQNPKASISNAIVGTNTVAVYTKHQRRHEHEFAMHRSAPNRMPCRRGRPAARMNRPLLLVGRSGAGRSGAGLFALVLLGFFQALMLSLAGVYGAIRSLFPVRGRRSVAVSGTGRGVSA